MDEIEKDVAVLKSQMSDIKWLGGIIITLLILNLTITVVLMYFVTNYLISNK